MNLAFPGIISSRNTGGSYTPPIDTPSELFSFSYSSTNGIGYKPEDYDPLISYPILLFYAGDGGAGSAHIVTNQSLGTGNGSQTVFTGNFVNGSTQDVLTTEVIIKKAGVEVARGQRGETISGTGVTGTMVCINSAGGAISVTFSTAPTSGQAITVDYRYSDLIGDSGTLDRLNRGDIIPGMFVFGVQSPTAADYNLVTHFDNLLTHILTYGYNINWNRLYVTGLSRGGRACAALLDNRTSQIAASITAASIDRPGSWTGLTDIGTWWHHGTADGTAAYNLSSICNDANVVAGSMNIPPETTAYWNLGHSASVWDNNLYSRRDMTYATGLAPYDYIVWLKAYSKDQNERATLHVERAEVEVTIDNYRKAYRQVDALSGGSLKTSLLSRLSSVLALIGNVFTVDFVTTGNESTSDIFTYNNKITASSGSSISLLADIFNTGTSIGFTVVAQLTTAGTKISSIAKFGGFYHGMARNTNNYGAVSQLTTTTGQVKFTGLSNSRRFSILVYGLYQTSGVSTQSELTVTINGVQKTRYTENNTYFPVEFNNIPPSGGEIIIDLDNTQDRITKITAIDLILEPL